MRSPRDAGTIRNPTDPPGKTLLTIEAHTFSPWRHSVHATAARTSPGSIPRFAAERDELSAAAFAGRDEDRYPCSTSLSLPM
jgi:hypothetical protein